VRIIGRARQGGLVGILLGELRSWPGVARRTASLHDHLNRTKPTSTFKTHHPTLFVVFLVCYVLCPSVPFVNTKFTPRPAFGCCALSDRLRPVPDSGPGFHPTQNEKSANNVYSVCVFCPVRLCGTGHIMCTLSRLTPCVALDCGRLSAYNWSCSPGRVGGYSARRAPLLARRGSPYSVSSRPSQSYQTNFNFQKHLPLVRDPLP
jgi:hypothetical protein